MKDNGLPKKNRKAVVAAVSVLIILIPFGYSVISAVLSPGSEDVWPFLEMPDAKYKECVRETDYMRYHHMHLLQEVRDEAVREGTRGKIRLDECRKCHSNRATFCDRCHIAVNLTPDCYGCHYYPESVSNSADHESEE